MMQRVPGYYEPEEALLGKKVAPQAMRFLVTKQNDRALEQDVKMIGKHRSVKHDPGRHMLSFPVKSYMRFYGKFQASFCCSEAVSAKF